LRIRSLVPALVISCAAFSQQGVGTPTFEVADIKPSVGDSPNGGKIRILPGGQIELPEITIKNLIMVAYGVQEDMITGGPGWMDSDHFDIIAKTPPNTPRDQLRLMMQPLLAERFKLAIHREDKQKPVYVLVVAKNGPKLAKSAGGPTQCKWNPVANGMIERECRNMTMRDFADSMPGWGMARIDLPVVDMTGLDGAFDFKLQWAVPGGGGDADKADGANAAPDPIGATVFDAMGQIGLRLEPRNRPVSVVVIDHIERLPTAN
jgi:uncharacterized protein (TIGR03435 family)